MASSSVSQANVKGYNNTEAPLYSIKGRQIILNVFTRRLYVTLFPRGSGGKVKGDEDNDVSGAQRWMQIDALTVTRCDKSSCCTAPLKVGDRWVRLLSSASEGRRNQNICCHRDEIYLKQGRSRKVLWGIGCISFFFQSCCFYAKGENIASQM